MDYKEIILKNLSEKNTVGELRSAAGVKSSAERKTFNAALDELEKEGLVYFIDGFVYSSESPDFTRGVIRGNERRFAFLTPDGADSDDLFIPPKKLMGALDKDIVIARKIKGGSGDEAEVVKILKRGVTELFGTFVKKRDLRLVYPDDRNFGAVVAIPPKFSGNAAQGDKVRVDIIGYNEDGPEGRVAEILGKSGEFEVEREALIRSFGFDEDFPEKVKREVLSIPQKVDDNQLIGRLDFTDRLIITIDGDDSRDFDDAVEVEKLANGNFRLGTHIADVSEYVKKGSALDDEAFKRGTSVYFPESVVPMLPQELSNGICSLNEGEVRLTLSCIAEIDKNGEVVDYKLAKSAIRSRHRMTYKQVQSILDGDEELTEKYSDVAPMLFLMNDLKNVLSAKRERRGSVDLDVKEGEITVTDGKIAVEPRKALTAYKIIEEFMVLTNEIVAEYAFFAELPFIYRIHEKPSEEKAKFFIDFINLFGLNVKWKASDPRPSDYAAVLKAAEGKFFFPLVNKVMLRSMQKAEYSPTNEGHFGLASKCYCHFTSPIRRYPDLVVHRVIKMTLDGRIGELNDLYAGFTASAAKSSSLSERAADEAERKVDDLYKTEYMRKFIGMEFDAIVSGVTPNGIYSELENTVEGFTGVEDLPRGNYVYDEKTFTLSAGKNKRYSLGDRVRVGVLYADIAERRIRFLILGKIS